MEVFNRELITNYKEAKYNLKEKLSNKIIVIDNKYNHSVSLKIIRIKNIFIKDNDIIKINGKMFYFYQSNNLNKLSYIKKLTTYINLDKSSINILSLDEAKKLLYNLKSGCFYMDNF